MTTRKRLDLTVYVPALVANDGRTRAAVRGMERALPGLRLNWEVGKGGRAIELQQRDAWLVDATTRGKLPLLCNGDECYPVTVSGRGRSGRLGPGGHPLLDVHAELPLDAVVIAAAGEMLERVAEGACAFWGHATPDDAGLDIAYQTAPTLEGPPSPRRGLPALKLLEQIRAPEIPYYLGWLNYWSAAAAQAIGFPDPSRDAELLSRSRRTASGGWVVQLTDAPLDLDNPTHLDALLLAYERFPEIGGRAVP
ncbi:hypothetical protein JY651_23415 [Pyxidicoccus parkwayensis]|uniref:Uncharacterized protein n=1 Tax=Pyxidicoccus parkwayensis TaxID=2813578 RepID=A0ABX7PB27_9BACT|nr:DUF5953 family protein [Pyxidicoccus parkwaysis]QSQ27676.1 hypothetical protein JY651_23415 [Pyxidicoccus parkwaysis]